MKHDELALQGGESLSHLYERKTFKLIGLNKPWSTAGFNSIYATVEYGNEDWFHCGFDKELYSDERLKALFDLFKNSEDSLWAGREHKVIITFDGYFPSGKPKNPLIKEVHLAKI